MAGGAARGLAGIAAVVGAAWQAVLLVGVSDKGKANLGGEGSICMGEWEGVAEPYAVYSVLRWRGRMP